MQSENPELIYSNRLVKVSKCIDDKGNKYKIEITDGRFCRFYEGYFDNDADAIKNAKREMEDPQIT